MKESAQAALSYVRSHAERLGHRPRLLREVDLHVHVPRRDPEGRAVGRRHDATALASLLTGRPVRPTSR